MAQTKIRGNKQILDKSIYHQQLADDAGVLLTQLAEGAELLKRDGSVALTGNLNAAGKEIVGLAPITEATPDTNAATVGYVKTKTEQLAAGVIYKGLFDAAAATQFPSNPKLGDMYKVSTAGTVDGMALTVGDMLIANATVTGTTLAANWDRIDAIEAVLTVNGLIGNVEIDAANLKDSQVSVAEFNFLKGVTSAVQTQLDAKLDDSQLDAAANLGDALASDDKIASQKAVKTYVDNGLALKVDKTQIDIAVDLGATTPSDVKIASQKAVKAYVDAQIGSGLPVFVYEEQVGGTVDGVNTAFTLAQAPKAGTVQLYLNGMRLRAGAANDYTITAQAITMNFAPEGTDVLVADYRTN